MWLLPVFSLASRLFSAVYYRMVYGGKSVPKVGPALIFANHPNSLLDPMLVVSAAGRPVRFLAKAPLFDDPKVGWLVKASGSIPVYRRSDDPAQMGQNLQTFSAVHDALVGGSAVGIFPEGVSHSGPAIAELKTGAARIALGAADEIGGDFPLVPVGLVPERKDRFRSKMLVIVGELVDWSDLAGRGAEDRDAVRELTSRIEERLRSVTLNLDAWEDQPLVEAAETIWSSRNQADMSESARLARLEVTTRILAGVRRGGDPEGRRLHDALADHCREIDRLGLRTADLSVDARLPARMQWLLRRAYLVGFAALVPFVFSLLIFTVPYQLTDKLTRLANQPEDRVSTYKLLIGVVAFGAWIVLLSVGAAFWLGPVWGVMAFLLLPPLGFWGNALRERWLGAGKDVLRFRRLWRIRAWIEELRAEEDRLAGELDAIFRRHEAGELGEGGGSEIGVFRV